MELLEERPERTPCVPGNVNEHRGTNMEHYGTFYGTTTAPVVQYNSSLQFPQLRQVHFFHADWKFGSAEFGRPSLITC